jgi:hypothetical protein
MRTSTPTELSQGQIRSPFDRSFTLKSERGNAVALVLMVLAVVTLLGLGLMTQSKIDTKFVGAYKNYDSMFNLADGASQLAYKWWNDNKEKLGEPKDYKGGGFSIAVYPGPRWGKTDGTSVDATFPPPTGALWSAGSFWPVVVFLGTGQTPSDTAGWEAGSFVTQYWVCQGIGRRQDIDPTTKKVIDTATNVKYMPAETSVQLAVTRLVRP